MPPWIGCGSGDDMGNAVDTLPSSLRTELDLITEQELASHLKICRRQLYNWRVGGLIPYFKMGKAVRFRVADVAAAIERMRIGYVSKIAGSDDRSHHPGVSTIRAENLWV